MVSEKVIVILLIAAIVLSVISIVVTIGADVEEIPSASPGQVIDITEDMGRGNVQLVVEPNTS